MTDDHATAVAPERRRTGRRAGAVALGAAFVLSAVGVGTAVGHFGLREDRAPAAVAKPVRLAAPGYGAHSDGDHYGSLGDLLLPEPGGYTYGPDEAGLGDNTVLTHDQYVKMFDSDYKALSSSSRQELENELDLQNVIGYAFRTYSDNSTWYLKISLLQENQHTAKTMAGLGTLLARETGSFRAGPTVAGHPEAHCYLPPSSPNDPIDQLDCDAYVGDLLVSLHAIGTAPLDQQTVAHFMELQLTRLAIPAAQI